MMAVLGGVRVLELAGLAPAPFCGLVLAGFFLSFPFFLVKSIRVSLFGKN